MSGAPTLEVEVNAIDRVAQRIKRFRLTPVAGGPLPAWSPGAHILITLTDGASTWRNAYSLMGSPVDRSSYQVTVLHTEHSRGGSRYLHQAIQPGARLSISPPVNLFPLAALGRKHIFVAGGIGITPFLPMMEQLQSQSVPFALHYVMRNKDGGAYAKELAQAYGFCVHIHETGVTGRPSIAKILDGHPLGTHLYVCGPEQMAEQVITAGREAGWPQQHLHSEHFLAGSAGRPFTVSLARSKQSISVSEHQSVLEAIEAAGIDAPFLCRGGSCGQCETAVVACDGGLLHKDHYLTAEERQAGNKIMICVSRAESGNLVLDL